MVAEGTNVAVPEESVAAPAPASVIVIVHGAVVEVVKAEVEKV
jgi:hypothetical protein